MNLHGSSMSLHGGTVGTVRYFLHTKNIMELSVSRFPTSMWDLSSDQAEVFQNVIVIWCYKRFSVNRISLRKIVSIESDNSYYLLYSFSPEKTRLRIPFFFWEGIRVLFFLFDNFLREGGRPEVCLCDDDTHVCLFHLFNFTRRCLCLVIMLILRTFLLQTTDGEQDGLWRPLAP